MKTSRTTITIDDWGDEKNEDDTQMLMEHIFKAIKGGYTSGHENQIYWTLKVEERE